MVRSCMRHCVPCGDTLHCIVLHGMVFAAVYVCPYDSVMSRAGGQTVSQALVAACCTVSPAYTVHSLHSYFLRPGNNDLPILYFVRDTHTHTMCMF